jgi:dTDP-4-dehydrorhamnose reductase
MTVEKIVIIGAGGQLGRELITAFAEREVLALDMPEVDITRPDTIEQHLKKMRPDLVLNAAAYVNVDKAESERDAAFKVNAEAVGQLATLCGKYDCRLIHYSTDYVFDGQSDQPYRETDETAPINVYGASKLAGERLLEQSGIDYQILRTCGLYTVFPCLGKQGHNFTQTVLRIAREQGEIKLVDDEICTPTYAADLAEQTKVLADAEQGGIFHATNDGGCSWCEFATEAFRLAELEVSVTAVSSSYWNSPAKRPPYSVLKNNRLKGLGLDRMRPWQKALAAYMTRKKEQPGI